LATDEKGQEALVLQWRLQEWFPELSKEVLEKLKFFHDHVVRHNKVLSLLPPKTMGAIDMFHFADCIMATRIITKAEPNLKKIYDFGSGAGFPGIVFAILNTSIDVVLVESDGRKSEVLKEMAQGLGLKNISVLHQGIETLPEGSVQTAMARGYASISKSILTCRKLFPKGGHLFHLKGQEWGLEISEIPTQLCSVWSPSLVGDYKFPTGGIKMAVVLTEKIA
jgi:16S rRNA (guanine527-N7)-methyltransferase